MMELNADSKSHSGIWILYTFNDCFLNIYTMSHPSYIEYFRSCWWGLFFVRLHSVGIVQTFYNAKFLSKCYLIKQ